MKFELEISQVKSSSFCSVARKDGGGKTLGSAYFWRDGKKIPARWKARVDIKTYLHIGGLGIATAILQHGDEYISQNYPSDLRAFEDTNGYSYRRYLGDINDDQLVDVEENEIIFKP